MQHTDLASDAGIEVLSDWAGWHTGGLVEELRSSPVRLATMGRSLEEDPAAFLAAAAAGRHAARLVG